MKETLEGVTKKFLIMSKYILELLIIKIPCLSLVFWLSFYFSLILFSIIYI